MQHLQPRSSIPAVTHVDYSARLQTVHAETNPRFWGLLKATELDRRGLRRFGLQLGR